VAGASGFGAGTSGGGGEISFAVAVTAAVVAAVAAAVVAEGGAPGLPRVAMNAAMPATASTATPTAIFVVDEPEEGAPARMGASSSASVSTTGDGMFLRARTSVSC